MNTEVISWVDPYLSELEKSNPDLFIEYISQLAKERETAQILCNYKGTSKDVLEKIAKNHLNLRAKILLHPNCPQELITWAIGAENKDLAYEVIKSPLPISGDELQRLWKRGDMNVKVATTSREECPTDLIMDTWNLDFSGDSLFENNKEVAIRNIASHPNIPKKLIVELMKYPLDLSLDGELNLGQLLMLNPSISDETKALLAIRGVEKKITEAKNEMANSNQSWPSTQAYKLRKISEKIRDYFSRVGHPESLLDVREDLAESSYSSSTVLEYWASESSNRIYKCLWPDLVNNPKVHTFYVSNSWQGDHSYVGVEGSSLDLSDDEFKNKLHGEQGWIASTNSLSYQEVMDEIQEKGFNVVLEDEAPEEMLLAAAIGERSKEDLFSITEKGMKFIHDEGNDWFEDEITYLAQVNPDNSQKVWSQLDPKRQQAIVDVIKTALLETTGEYRKFAEYLGALLALNPALSSEVREQLENLPSELIKQAFNV